MKFKKYQKGGKTPKEIIAEARRNQALEQEAQRVDRAMLADPAREQAVATANIATPRYLNTPAVNIPQISNRFNAEIKTSNQTFDQAFAAAQKAGLKEFEWFNPKTNRVEKITVKLANEPTNTPAATSTNKSANTNKSENNTSTEEVSEAVTPQTTSQFLTPSGNVQNLITGTPTGTSIILTPHWGAYGQFSRTAPRSTASTATSTPVTNISVRTTRGPQAGSTPEQRRANRQAIWGPLINAWKANRAYVQYTGPRSIMKQGGQIPKFQQGGGILDRIKQKLSERFTDPNRYQVNNNVSTTYKQRTPFIGVPTETRSITGPNRQTSKMVIRRPGTERADTTFYSPGRAKNPDLYPPFTPQDIREGNRKGKGNESFMQKFTSPDYFPHLRKYQQGGPVEETNEEMVILDFAIRYLRGLGVSETELESGIPEQWLQDEEFISTINTFANDPDAMMAYQEDPEATIQNYLSAEQELTDDQVEFAKKGAKLKQLKSKQKRCKCGCLMEYKEEGGKLVSKCSCGCKTQ